jgi:L-alanine-DL-glutamate epimerase-like enolase superfamily enzyme
MPCGLSPVVFRVKSPAALAVEIPDKPGWGYEMNEEAFKHMPAKPWH